MDASFARRIVSLQWNRSLAIAVCGLLGIGFPAAYAWCTAIPSPRVHDEFCYLLAADTFAHGRLTNPSPSLPEFFEAEHLLVVPTYMAKFPPGQGLCLAVGQVVVGHPVFGVWLSCGVFAASLCWMLQSWVTPRWALALTLSVILVSGVSSYWCQSYWGGMVAACGGALLFGGLRRTIRRPRVFSSLLMGLGIVVLAGTRPFEGLLACLPAAAVMAWWLATERRVSFANKFTGWLLPVSSLCVAGAVGLAIYNHAVTGDWRELPYLLHQRQYFYSGLGWFTQPRTPERVPCERIARFYGESQPQPAKQKQKQPSRSVNEQGAESLPAVPPASQMRSTVAPVSRQSRRHVSNFQSKNFGFDHILAGELHFLRPQIETRHGVTEEATQSTVKITAGVAKQQSRPTAVWAGVRRFAVSLLVMGQRFLAMGFTGTGFSGASFGYSRARLWMGVAAFALVLIAGHRNRWVRFCCATIGLSLIGTALIGWWWPHYAAPVLALLYAATAVAFCRIDHACRHRWLPARCIRPAIVVLISLLLSVAGILDSRATQLLRDRAFQQRAESTTEYAASRANLLKHLHNQPGGHLVFVRYSESYPRDDEWVYNAADMQTAKVIFAHDLGDENNRRLIELHSDRNVWLATVAIEFNSLFPYDERPDRQAKVNDRH